MSLTSILSSSQFADLKERLRTDFPKPKFQLKGNIVAPPKTKNYGIIGAAFDYLFRFRLEHEFKGKIEAKEDWVADLAIESIKEFGVFKETKPNDITSGDGTKMSKQEKIDLAVFMNILNKQLADSKNDFYNKVVNLYDEAKSNYQSFISSGNFTEELAKSSIVLAKLDLYSRAGILDDSISTFEKEDLEDLESLFSIIPIKEFEPKKKITLNPHFGDGSALFMGADADLIVDNKLIDVKTTKNLEIDRYQLNQLLCYAIAARIGGINGDEQLKNEIEQIGIYFSRHGQLWTMSLDEFGTAEKFREFEKWIPIYFEKKLGA